MRDIKKILRKSSHSWPRPGKSWKNGPKRNKVSKVPWGITISSRARKILSPKIPSNLLLKKIFRWRKNWKIWSVRRRWKKKPSLGRDRMTMSLIRYARSMHSQNCLGLVRVMWGIRLYKGTCQSLGRNRRCLGTRANRLWPKGFIGFVRIKFISFHAQIILFEKK